MDRLLPRKPPLREDCLDSRSSSKTLDLGFLGKRRASHSSSRALVSSGRLPSNSQHSHSSARHNNSHSNKQASFSLEHLSSSQDVSISIRYGLWLVANCLLESQPVTAQMASILSSYLPNSPNCKFKYYFYNKVGSDRVPFYGPNTALNEDPRSWDEALSKKPGPGYVPVLCTGFEQLGERIKAQQTTLAGFNRIMHQINGSLEAMMARHDTGTSVRILNVKRKHTALKQRTLKLATKVQILRNKGYAMDKAEEALKTKLEELERQVMDPQIPAKAEEIWARMVAVRARGRILEKEMAKSGQIASGLDEEAARRAEKVLEDYATQLAHLKKELVSIQKEFEEYQKEQSPQEAKKR